MIFLVATIELSNVEVALIVTALALAPNKIVSKPVLISIVAYSPPETILHVTPC